jgi:hypothetical protein
MQTLWRLLLTIEGAAGTTMERQTEALPLLLPPAVKRALAHLRDKTRDPTVALVIELNCECTAGDQDRLCEELRGEGWEHAVLK